MSLLPLDHPWLLLRGCLLGAPTGWGSGSSSLDLGLPLSVSLSFSDVGSLGGSCGLGSSGRLTPSSLPWSPAQSHFCSVYEREMCPEHLLYRSSGAR